MSKFNLVYYPAKILRTICQPVDDLDILHKHNVFGQMKSILKKHDGIGLAAPQVGLDARIVLIAPRENEHFFLINPEIIMKSDRQLLDREGCLSLPEIFGNIVRHETIGIKALTPEGKEIELETNLLTARIIQHEIDHLNGVLFTDNAISLTHGEDVFKKLQNKATPEER